MTDIKQLASYKLAVAIHMLTEANEAFIAAYDTCRDKRLETLLEELRVDTISAIQLYSDLRHDEGGK